MKPYANPNECGSQQYAERTNGPQLVGFWRSDTEHTEHCPSTHHHIFYLPLRSLGLLSNFYIEDIKNYVNEVTSH